MAHDRTVAVILVVFFLAAAATCSRHKQPAIDIFGLRVGMGKDDAHSRLTAISDFVRDERKNQEIWNLKDASSFASVAVGYNRDDRIRYVTAFVDKEKAREHISFKGIGDLESAKAEIMEPHHRYIWEVPQTAGRGAYTVNVYGDNPEFVTIYTLAANPEDGNADENVEEDDD